MGHPRHDPSSRPSLARALASYRVRIDVTEPTASTATRLRSAVP
jgi:hypothetical protein